MLCVGGKQSVDQLRSWLRPLSVVSNSTPTDAMSTTADQTPVRTQSSLMSPSHQDAALCITLRLSVRPSVRPSVQDCSPTCVEWDVKHYYTIPVPQQRKVAKHSHHYSVIQIPRKWQLHLVVTFLGQVKDQGHKKLWRSDEKCVTHNQRRTASTRRQRRTRWLLYNVSALCMRLMTCKYVNIW